MVPDRPTSASAMSLLPEIFADEIQRGRLPHLKVDGVLLSAGEVCHFLDRAKLVEEKTVVSGYTAGSSGWSFRVLKGVYYRLGLTKGKPVRESVQDTTDGLLYITNKRVVFVSRRRGFDAKIDKVSAIIPFLDAVSIQVGNKNYSVMLPQPEVAASVLQLLRR